ncbi:lipopolysaccharide transport periplasmic protein LptA [Microbulbifer sp. OS29]|uniref:Lipopolysaccharide export system protein LptA n=1 Tax=Microbulbifer okhotskensis TaxID=2926617 RepID=A0A9X2EQA8_9GAMM|nr:lipopolysaccharide transport periplasmic protein LptA [Microbulbifer okhotskensis]MCO1333723.1 lipopolysaccharide transport periplasmic protein LptA [Microbulbifer okhotskensis]
MALNKCYRPIYKVLTAIALVAIAIAAQALPGDRTQKISVGSDSMSADRANNLVVYNDNVVITQGSLQIRADRVEVYFTASDEISRVVAVGRPAHFQQKILESQNPVKARAERIEYVISSEELQLTGQAFIDRDGNTLTAEKIDYDLATEQMSARSQPGNGRVEMIWKPESTEDNKNSSSD